MTRLMRAALAGVLLAIWTVTVSTPPASAASCADTGRVHHAASTCGDELRWVYDQDSHTFRYGTHLGTGPEDPYDYKPVADCDTSDPTPHVRALCTRATTCPPRTNPDGTPMTSLRIAVYQAPHGTTAWQPTPTTTCQYTGTTIPLTNLTTTIHTHLATRVGHPTITTNPPGGTTLINLPTIYSAPPQHPTTLTITTPIPGTITATPTYTWTLDDHHTATGPGHPYTPTINPTTDHTGYYLTATYTHPGTKHITTTLTWHTTFTLTGQPPITITPITLTATTTITARTAHPQLVNN